MRLRHLLTATAVLWVASAAVALAAPAAQLAIYGVADAPGTRYMARWAGLGSLAVGTLAFLLRDVTDARARRAAALGLLVYFGVGALLSALGAATGAVNAAGWPLLAVNVLFAAGYARFLLGAD